MIHLLIREQGTKGQWERWLKDSLCTWKSGYEGEQADLRKMVFFPSLLAKSRHQHEGTTFLRCVVCSSGPQCGQRMWELDCWTGIGMRKECHSVIFVFSMPLTIAYGQLPASGSYNSQFFFTQLLLPFCFRFLQAWPSDRGT